MAEVIAFPKEEPSVDECLLVDIDDWFTSLSIEERTRIERVAERISKYMDRPAVCVPEESEFRSIRDQLLATREERLAA